MALTVARCHLMKLAVVVAAFCFLCTTVSGCVNSTTPDPNLGSLHLNPTLSTCVTEMLRALCGALRPSPIRRNTELINSILGLPRVLQDAGR